MKEQNLAGKSFVVSGLKVIGADSRSRAEAVKTAVRSSAGTWTLQLQYADLEKRVSDAVADNILTPKEKKELQRQWLAIEGMYGTLVEQAKMWGLDNESDERHASYQEYLSVYDALKAAVDKLFYDMDSQSTIDGAALQALFQTYYVRDTELNKLLYNRSHGDVEGKLDAVYVKSIDYTYAVTATQDQPNVVTSQTIPTMSEENKYLWQKEVITYKNGTTHEYISLLAVYGDKGATGDVGKSFTVVIESTNGSVFRMPNVSTTLLCRVYVNGEEVTDAIDESAFRWTRKTDDAQSDESWNSSSKAIGHRTVDITPDDCHGRTVFDCSVDLEI